MDGPVTQTLTCPSAQCPLLHLGSATASLSLLFKRGEGYYLLMSQGRLMLGMKNLIVQWWKTQFLLRVG